MMPDEQETKNTARLETLSDGIIAIAITLLVLEIRVPQVEQGHSLLEALADIWPSYLAYFISFATIGVMWINHHRIFKLVARADNRFIVLNLLLMLLMTFVNFPTALLAEYIRHAEAQVAAAVYSGTFFLIAIVFNLLWRYAAGSSRLLSRSADPREVQSIFAQYRFGPLFYLAALLLAFVSAGLSVALNLALVIFFALPGRERA